MAVCPSLDLRPHGLSHQVRCALSLSPERRLVKYASAVSCKVSKPQAKFVLEMLAGMSRSQSVVLSRIAAALEEDIRPINTIRRLSRHLRSYGFEDTDLLEAHYGRWHRRLREGYGAGVAIAFDHTDARKDYADLRQGRGMDGVGFVRDGSRHEEAPGVRFFIVEAVLPGGIRVLLAHDPQETVISATYSENLAALDCLGRIAPHVGSEAIYCGDRGFDRNIIMEGLDRLETRWIIRLRRDHRHLTTQDGRVGLAEDLIETPKLRRYNYDEREVLPRRMERRRRKRRGGRKRLSIKNARVRFIHVRAKNGPASWRTLLGLRLGDGSFLRLLADRVLETRKEIRRYVAAYLARWSIEETARSQASRRWGVDLEDYRVLRWRALKKLSALVVLLYGFLAELQLAGEPTIDDLARRARIPEPRGPDPRYRLLAGLSDHLDELFIIRRLRRRRPGRRKGRDVDRQRGWQALI